MAASKKPTLVSLARELGVSHQTVSNVINSPELVRPETRERVQEAIRRSGYRPSALGRALRNQRSQLIAYRLSPQFNAINAALMDHFLHVVTERAAVAGFRLCLIPASDDATELRQLGQLHDAHAIDGSILTGTTATDTRPAELAKRGLPCVSFGRPWGSLPGSHSWVDVESAAATRAAVAALRARGHDRIGFLGWPTGSGVGDDRRAGWLEGVSDLAPDASWSVAVTDDEPASGRAAAQQLKQRGMTALVCASDTLAIGAYPEFNDPAQTFVPITGFDDTPAINALGLSSCRQPVDQAAAWCVEQLVSAIKHPDSSQPAQALLQAEFIERERLA